MYNTFGPTADLYLKKKVIIITKVKTGNINQRKRIINIQFRFLNVQLI